jgi:hypothetical protein
LDFSTANRLTVMRIACERSATSYIEGENVAIKYRWAENQRKRLPALAAELVRRQVASIGLTSATLSNSCTKIRKRRSADWSDGSYKSGRWFESSQVHHAHQREPAFSVTISLQ